MIDPRRLRLQTGEIAARLRLRGVELDVAYFQDLEARRKRLQDEVEQLRKPAQTGLEANRRGEGRRRGHLAACCVRGRLGWPS